MDKFKDPEVRDFSQNQEISGIRFEDPGNAEDMRRMREMVDDKLVQRDIDELVGLTDEEMMRWMESYKRLQDDGWEVLIGVVGKYPYVKESEVGCLQGFINFEENEATRKRFANNRPVNANDKSGQAVEISDARYPKAKPGQMSSGIRQAVLKLREMKGPMVIFGFVEITNNAGMRTLEDACFESERKALVPDDHGEQYLYVLNWDKLDSKLGTTKVN